MTQLLSSQEELSEQVGVLLLTLEKTAQAYFLSGQAEQALQLFQIGMQLIHMPEVMPRVQARFKLSYGNMLTIVKTNFENAPVEDALAVLEDVKQTAAELDDAQLLADALNGIGYAHYIASSNKREGDPHSFSLIFKMLWNVGVFCMMSGGSVSLSFTLDSSLSCLVKKRPHVLPIYSHCRLHSNGVMRMKLSKHLVILDFLSKHKGIFPRHSTILLSHCINLNVRGCIFIYPLRML